MSAPTTTTSVLTTTTLETAAVTFLGGLLGYLGGAASFVVNSATLGHGIIVGGIAALIGLGYHAYVGNISTTTAVKAA